MSLLSPARSLHLLAAALCTLAAAGIAAAADPSATPSPPSIAVSAEGEMQIDPDRASVSITIDSDAPSSAAAGSDNARRTQAVVAALRAAGAAAADIATVAYTVQPQYVYAPSGPPHRSGYRASTELQLSVSNLQRLGPWIDAALTSGASGVGNVQYDASRMAQARQQTLAQAVHRAQSDAEVLAQAAGGRLGALLELSTQEPGLQPGMQRFAMAAAPGPAPGTSFQTMRLQVRAVVLARWAFTPGP